MNFFSAVTSEPSPGALWSGSVQRRDFVQDCQPTRRRTAVAEDVRHNFVLHHITGYQRPVRFDKRQLIPLGMRAAEPEQARRDTAQVNLRLSIERNIRCAERGICQ
jgi:hypothetical protein